VIEYISEQFLQEMQLDIPHLVERVFETQELVAVKLFLLLQHSEEKDQAEI